MRISTEIASIARVVGGEERAVRLVAEAGFDCFDFSMFAMAKYDYSVCDVVDFGHPLAGADYLKFARHIGRVAGELGISCNQSHAPFPVANPTIRDRLKRALECTAEAGGKICVIHPNNNLSAEQNAEMFLDLLPFARGCGVKIATENMWNWNRERDEAGPAACSHHTDFLAHLNAVGDDYLVACLDIGHAEMRGLNTSAREMILTLGPHLQALHLHDNDRWHDSHQIPFSMEIDFGEVVRALRRVGYAGEFTLEADRYLASQAGRDPADCVRDLATAARRLARMYEEAPVTNATE